MFLCFASCRLSGAKRAVVVAAVTFQAASAGLQRMETFAGGEKAADVLIGGPDEDKETWERKVTEIVDTVQFKLANDSGSAVKVEGDGQEREATLVAVFRTRRAAATCEQLGALSHPRTCRCMEPSESLPSACFRRALHDGRARPLHCGAAAARRGVEQLGALVPPSTN